MNTVQITGNLAKDPTIRATKTGKAVASFSVGVSKRITKTNGDILDLTDWVNVTAWGKLAEAVGNELTKGSYVFIEGRYSTRSYDTPDGQRRYITEVVANVIAKPIGSNQQSMNAGFSGGTSVTQFSAPVKFEDMGTVSKEPGYNQPEYEQDEIPF
uniref:Single strand binding protein n=1 Tax=Siphoviridae sp. ctkyE7 TaxID=2827926 RepID=A0A8S5SQX5_9CAUD|nr:MAG TPA: Single strand binding protein [Siphoviridae sp. ctkyE7]